MRRTERGAVRAEPVEIALAAPADPAVLRAGHVGASAGPGATRPAVLVAADRVPAPDPGGLIEELSAAGFDVLVPDFGGALSEMADRRAGGALEACLAWLADHPDVDGDRLGVLGLDGGGTHAYLLACTSRRLACAVAVDPVVVRPSLSAERPVQPLELALNLSCPIALHFSARGAAGSEDAERLRATLDQFAKEAEVRVHDGDVLLGAGERYDDAVPRGPRAAALAFLRTHLEEPPS